MPLVKGGAPHKSGCPSFQSLIGIRVSWDNGPEISTMGYSVTPLGAAAALGTLAAVQKSIKRYAVLRK